MQVMVVLLVAAVVNRVYFSTHNTRKKW